VIRLIHGLHTVEYGGLTARFLMLLLYGADIDRMRSRVAWLATRARRIAARCTAVLCVAAAWTIWQRAEPGPAATFITCAGLMVIGTLIALFTPIAPRAVAFTVAASALSLPLLLLMQVWP
jgi:hypothetical protein